MVSSSAAKEESLADMMKVMSKYANVIVLRHPNDVEARKGASYSEAPVINGGLWGLGASDASIIRFIYTLAYTFPREGLNVCVASADLVAARTGHSMALGLARLGANVTLASPKKNRIPDDVREKLSAIKGNVEEVYDLDQGQFNELIGVWTWFTCRVAALPKGRRLKLSRS